MAKISETLRQLRLDRGMTQEQVAEQVGLTRQAVSGYESGRTQPGVDILQRLAEIYQVELTDIIYGRGKALRLYNALKVTAMVMAVLVLAAQLVEALLMWTANRFFSLEPGMMDEAEKLVWATRAKLMDARGVVDGLYAGLFPLFCVAILVLTLCLRRPLRTKTKVICAGGFAAASMVVVLPWALTDTFYPVINYLLQPWLCLAQLAVFLLLSLIIDLFRVRKLGCGDSVEVQSDSDGAVQVPLYKRWWLWVALAGVAVLTLILTLIPSPHGQAEIPPVENPAFSLNGEDYPQDPILQDFLDRGWKRGKSLQQTGNYSEEDGVSNLVVTGYRLNSGENHVSTNLYPEEVRSGQEPEACHLSSLSFYGEHVMSFCLDGKELSTVTCGEIESLLGQPTSVQELPYGGVNYCYVMSEQGISWVSFIFENANSSVGQILIAFE